MIIRLILQECSKGNSCCCRCNHWPISEASVRQQDIVALPAWSPGHAEHTRVLSPACQLSILTVHPPTTTSDHIGVWLSTCQQPAAAALYVSMLLRRLSVCCGRWLADCGDPCIARTAARRTMLCCRLIAPLQSELMCSLGVTASHLNPAVAPSPDQFLPLLVEL